MPPSDWAFYLTVLSSLIGLTILLAGYDQFSVLIVYFGFFCFGCFLVQTKLTTDIDSHDIRRFVSQKQEAVITGTLHKMVSGESQSPKILINNAFFRTEAMDHLVKVSGRVLLTLNGEWPGHILPGDNVTIRAYLKKPSVINTPGVFDYRKYLARKNIHIVGSITSPLLIQKTSIPEHDIQISHYIERLRTSISNHLNTLKTTESIGLYRAILLGDRSSVPPEIINSFKRTGVLHILAISGLHMGLLGFFLFNLFFYFLKQSEKLILSCNIKKLSMLLCLPILFLYTMLAGANAPVVRSFIMSFFVILALCTDRTKSPLTILCCAALLMLMADPLVLETASFQLSFTAVISIIIITPKILTLMNVTNYSDFHASFFKTFSNWIITIISVSASATLGTIPILLFHFNQISTVTILANLIIEPFICLWSLPCGFLAIPFMFIYPPVADFILNIGMFGLNAGVNTAFFLSSSSLSTLWLPAPSYLAICLYYSALFFLLIPQLNSLKTMGLTLFITALFNFIFPLTPWAGIFRTASKVTFIDVGHGSSSLVELKSGRNILIDGGALSAPGFNCGERIISPFIWHRGIGRIDDIIITHADADHFNGVAVLYEKFRPQNLWLPHGGTDKPAYISMVNMALKHNIKIHYPANETVFANKNSIIKIIDHPKNRGKLGQLVNKKGTSYNDCGLVISLKTDGISFLFPGDISKEKERKLIEADLPLDVDILLSPHHGSSTSNSLPFLQRVNPQYFIVSSGDKTGKLFPSPSTLKNAESIDTTVLSTIKDGTITLNIKDKEIRLTSFKAKDVYTEGIIGTPL